MAPQTPEKTPPPHRIYFGTAVYTPTLGTLSIQHDSAIGVLPTGVIAFIDTFPAADLRSSTMQITPVLKHLAEKHAFPLDDLQIEDATDLFLMPPDIKHSSTIDPAEKVSAWRRRVAHPNRRRFFFPGMVDTHTHASQYPNTGVFGSSTLLDWLETYTFPLETSFASHSPGAKSSAARIYNRVVARTLAHGTTAAAYYATIHVAATNLLADVCLARGQRALIGRVCMDKLSPESYRDEGAEDAVRKTRAVMAHIEAIEPSASTEKGVVQRDKLIRPVITPRFAPSCSRDMLNALGALYEETKAPVQTHISENKSEIALVKELFPESQHYAGVYDAAGLLTDQTILAHCVHLTPEEIKLVKQREAGVSHCPISNTSLTSGAARIRTLLDAGVKVGLGTDMSGGYSASILEVARAAMGCSRHVAMGEEEGNEKERTKLNVAEALWLATAGGAEVMGLGDKIGKFEVGMVWDALLVGCSVVSDRDEEVQEDEGPVDLFGGESWENILAKWLYTGDDRNIEKVWVSGRLVHERSQKV